MQLVGLFTLILQKFSSPHFPCRVRGGQGRFADIVDPKTGVKSRTVPPERKKAEAAQELRK